jgi:hypothetical protein
LYVFKPDGNAKFMANEAEEFYSWWDREAGFFAPAARHGTLVTKDGPVQGVFVRHASGQKLYELLSKEPGLRLALRKKIAEDIVRSAFYTDGDRHGGNYLLARDGKTIAFDRNDASLLDRHTVDLLENNVALSPAVREMELEQAMKRAVRGVWGTTRLKAGPHYWDMAWIHTQVTWEDLRDAIRKVTGVAEGKANIDKISARLAEMDTLRGPDKARLRKQILQDQLAKTRLLEPVLKDYLKYVRDYQLGHRPVLPTP